MESYNSDAQRLITLSLGKIAASRGQRGGVNLHKSLLVSTILHKARNAYMIENLQVLMESRKASQEKKVVEVNSNATTVLVEKQQANTRVMDENDAPSCENSVAGSQSQEPCDPRHVTTSHRGSDDKENNRPVLSQRCGLSNNSGVVSSDESAQTKQNTLTDCNQNSATTTNTSTMATSKSEGSNCAKCCTKRRLTVSTEENTDHSSAKKTKCDLNNTQEFATESKQHTSSTSRDTVEPMQTETVQINNLVNSFSSGFGGLVESSRNALQLQSKGHSEQPFYCSSAITMPTLPLAVAV